ncbi:serine/threonine protein kinase [Aliikangiella maris]|uniref:Serine/threonine protein kinase n=2 Tax=Aliikangiella maris TaxID=3162458 RepID=A0ABV2BYB7_9GAMM
MNPEQLQDFYQLTPDHVLDALESVGLAPQAALLALNSYENRVYQFRDYDEQRFVVKFYRPNRWSDAQIIEEHQFTQELEANEIPVVAPLTINQQTLFSHANYRFAIYPNKGGRTPNLDDKETLVWLGRFIGRIHLMGEATDFKYRPTLTLQSFGHDAVNYLLAADFIPTHIQQAYQTTTQQILEYCEIKFSRYTPQRLLRLHGDCHPSNVLWTDNGPHFVDFDDSRMGPAVQDLWMLINDAQDASQWNAILEGYEDFREFDDREFKLIEPLRALRMLHYSAWLAQRWHDPSFQHNFGWFNTTKYWEEQVLYLKEQLYLVQQD